MTSMTGTAGRRRRRATHGQELRLHGAANSKTGALLHGLRRRTCAQAGTAIDATPCQPAGGVAISATPVAI